MRGKGLRAALLLTVLGLSKGCRERAVYAIERAEVRGVSCPIEAPVASAAELTSKLRRTLETHGGFRWVPTGKSRPEQRGLLEVEVICRRADRTDLGVEAPRLPSDWDVGASFTFRRGDQHFDVVEWGGLTDALSRGVAGVHARLRALELGEAQLLRELRSPERVTREAALAALVERKRPEAVEVLIEKLRSDDDVEVRQAVGALVELRATSAVPHLIELARGKEPSFLRELVFALGAIGGEEARAYLFTVAQGHDQPAIQEAAEEALQELEVRKR